MKAIVRCYSIDTRTESGAKAWADLCAKLEALGFHKFETLGSPDRDDYRRKIRELDGKQVTLDIDHIFDNQWNTKENLRVFDWYVGGEFSDPGPLKAGYWLDHLGDVKALRATRHTCGYCGYQEDNPQYTFHERCLASSHIQEGDLYLLRMQPISLSARPKLYPEEKAYLLPKLVRAKVFKDPDDTYTVKRAERIFADERKWNAMMAKRIREHAEGVEFLAEAGFNLNNFLYYNHSGVFAFGALGAPYSEAVADALQAALEGFPAHYTIQVKDGAVRTNRPKA